MKRLPLIILAFLTALLPASALRADDAHFWISDVEPVPQKEILLYRCDFSQPDNTGGWGALHDSTLSVQAEQKTLVVQSTGSDPYMMASLAGVDAKIPEGRALRGNLMVKIRGRGDTCGGYSVYWTNAAVPNFSESAATHRMVAKMPESGEIRLPLYSETPVTHLRLDFGSAPGTFYVEALELYAVEFPPLEMTLLPHEKVAETQQRPPQPGAYFLFDAPQTMRLQVKNPSATDTVTATVNGAAETFAPGETRDFPLTSDAKKPVDRLRWSVKTDGFPEMTREISILHKVPMTDEWRKLKENGKYPSADKNGAPSFQIFVAPDESVYYIIQSHDSDEGKIIAAIENKTPETLRKYIHLTKVTQGSVTLAFTLAADAPQSVEVPVLHVFSPMTYAVLPGVELLEGGEWSSSKLDIRTPAHKRFRPSPDLLTQQWMGIISTDAAFRFQWQDVTQQPTFAVPNYFDATPDARMSLTLKPGGRVTLTISAATPEQLCMAGFAGQVESHGLSPNRKVRAAAPVPQAVLPEYQQALETGGIRNENGWGHCIETQWPRQPYAGIASALYRMTGKVPEFPKFVGGGVHVPNDMIYFVSGHAMDAMHNWRGMAEDSLQKQDAEGGYSYDGPFAAGHFERTALGLCGSRAFHMLFAYAVAGEEKYRDAGLKTLAYMKRFNVARGAQCWEMPLHTPDPLAAAHAICAYTLAYRITGDPDHLKMANRWAAEGLTYIYMWDTPDRPFQFGAYIGVLGATHWENPLWIGRPVQWIGTVYAYALLDLADATNDKTGVVTVSKNPFFRGMLEPAAYAITTSGERQIYPDGPSRGLLPDSVDPVANLRFIYDINPSALVFLRLRIQGELDGLDVKWTDTHRVVSPFRITELTAEKVVIQAPPSVAFQILVNGEAREVPAGPENREVAF